MNKATKLLSVWDHAALKAADAQTNLEDYLCPIIKALNPNRKVYSIVRAYPIKEGLFVETQDSRDMDCWEHFTVPHAVLDAPNPLKAAQAITNLKTVDAEARRQEQIKAEIIRLQGLLK